MAPIKRAVCAAALLVLAAQGWALTLSQIRTQVRYNVRDTASDDSRRRYSDDVLDDLINEVQKDVQNQTWAVEASTSYTLTAGEVFYPLPSDFVTPKRVVFTRSSVAKVLTQKTEKGAYDDSPNFENVTGTPVYYIIRQDKDGAPSYEIAYLPVATSASTGTVRTDYICQPADMDSDDDEPFNGSLHLVPYHHALVYGTTFRIKLLEGKVDEATIYAQRYDREIQTMRDSVGKLPDFRPSLGAGPR